jgi:peptide/nickel transport system ATP-binding protein
MNDFPGGELTGRRGAAGMPPILRIRDLNVGFRTDGAWNEAVRSLDLDVGTHETVALVGESGSGKSVTALSIMRLLPKANSRMSGLIELNGRDLMGLSEEAMRAVRGNEVSMIFQEPMTSLNPTMTIGYQIAEALRWHRTDLDARAASRQARELLDQVRIPNARERFHDYPHQFSGGMRQRVMIAMALACEPSLLIADEPTTALDVTIQAQILDLIRHLQTEIGMSVLFITHDMGVVAEIADRVAVMYGGEKVEENRCERIFSQPEHPYTRMLLDAVPQLGTAGNMRTAPDAPPHDAAIIAAETIAAPADPALPPHLLQVSGLTVRFPKRGGLLNWLQGRIHAVENVSFAIDAGETLAFVGESGCGKSTIGRTMLGLTDPVSGRIIFDGDDIAQLSGAALRAKRRHMQVIFQDPFASLNPRQPIGSAIAEPIRVHGLGDRSEAAERTSELLRKVGLDPASASRLPHEFSGGQRQRICIARALALEPRLIVADESVSALDVSIRQRILDLMIGLQEELGLAFLFISHDIAVVERIAHRIAVLYLGEIVEIGPCQSVLRNPQHSYTRRLLDAVPRPNPARRKHFRPLATEEIPSPLKTLDYRPPERTYREIGAGHYVQLA